MNWKKITSRLKNSCMKTLVRLDAFYSLRTSYFFGTEQRDTQIREHLAKIASLEDAYQDLEGTVTQFRELVLQLQTYDLRTLASNS